MIRKAALWVFSLLFDMPDTQKALEEAIAANAPAPTQQRDDRFDRAIDGEYGVIALAGEQYYASELLFSVDYTAYREIGQRLCASDEPSGPEAGK